MLDGSACPSMADDFLHSSEPLPCADFVAKVVFHRDQNFASS
jgi:hypothetical protein